VATSLVLHNFAGGVGKLLQPLFESYSAFSICLSPESFKFFPGAVPGLLPRPYEDSRLYECVLNNYEQRHATS